GSSPKNKPVHPNDLLATTYYALGIDPDMVVLNHLNQPRELVKGKIVSNLWSLDRVSSSYSALPVPRRSVTMESAFRSLQLSLAPSGHTTTTFWTARSPPSPKCAWWL